MATLIQTLTLSSADATTDLINFSVVDNLTITGKVIGLSRVVTSTGDLTLFASSSYSRSYVYLKNTDGTNHIKYFNDTDDGFGILWPGEFAFFAVIDNEGLKVQANNAACILEYAYWTKA